MDPSRVTLACGRPAGVLSMNVRTKSVAPICIRTSSVGVMIVCQWRVLLPLPYRHGSVDSVVTIRGALGDVGATTLLRMSQVC